MTFKIVFNEDATKPWGMLGHLNTVNQLTINMTLARRISGTLFIKDVKFWTVQINRKLSDKQIRIKTFSHLL